MARRPPALPGSLGSSPALCCGRTAGKPSEQRLPPPPSPMDRHVAAGRNCCECGGGGRATLKPCCGSPCKERGGAASRFARLMGLLPRIGPSVAKVGRRRCALGGLTALLPRRAGAGRDQQSSRIAARCSDRRPACVRCRSPFPLLPGRRCAASEGSAGAAACCSSRRGAGCRLGWPPAPAAAAAHLLSLPPLPQGLRSELQPVSRRIADAAGSPDLTQHHRGSGQRPPASSGTAGEAPRRGAQQQPWRRRRRARAACWP